MDDPDAAAAATTRALLERLLQSQAWPRAQLQALQQSYLDRLFTHLRDEVPYYAARPGPWRQGRAPSPDSEAWLQLPTLTREELVRQAPVLRARNLPPAHGGTTTMQTSGSTGQPVEVVRTGLTQLVWEAVTLREHVWYQRDPRATVAAIRIGGSSSPVTAPGPDGLRFDSWGRPFDRLWSTGPAWLLDLQTDVPVQARWLHRAQPRYLVTYPTNLDALLDLFARGHQLSITEVSCVGETVTQALRDKCRAVLGARIVANYSSQEVGYLATQCPHCDQYHVQAESVLLEVLDEDGRPCPEGGIGRVVVTDLHNHAMPLVRYEIGDYAQAGGPCSGGFTLPSLRRVLGRRRNMLVYPDGRRHWPLTGFWLFQKVAAIRQYQFVQHTVHDIEVRVVVDEPLSVEQVSGLRAVIGSVLGPDFGLRFTEFREPLPHTRGGKFEEFVSLVP